MRLFFILITIIFSIFTSFSKQIVVGLNEDIKSIEQAVEIADFGDTIYVKAGVYNGGMYIENLRSNDDKYLYIIGENDSETIIQGSNTSIQFSSVRGIFIKNIVFEKQKRNILNFDDGGNYNNPSTRIIIENCTFRDIDATGNNDLLKLSGIDTFIVENCIFENGSKGGSGIDMVGCHNGRIEGNYFKNMGSNAIQAKGGTQYILIFRNYFENCGQRTLNLGGNTDLEYFRPQDAPFEAADIAVHSNIIIGSVAPIAFVGCIRVEVINNTIIKPENWVIRILQETVDEDRFYKCGQGVFSNNIIYLGSLKNAINIGPDTAPEEFLFNNNFWYNFENSNWAGPNTPTKDDNEIINLDPMFEDFDNYNFKLKSESSAIGYINGYAYPKYDFYNNIFSEPRSAGAIESSIVGVKNITTKNINIYPNPTNDFITISYDAKESTDIINVQIYDIFSNKVLESLLIDNLCKIDISHLPKGTYFIKINNYIEKFIKL